MFRQIQMKGTSTPSFNIANNQKQVLLSKISEIVHTYNIKSILDIGAGHPTLAVPLSKQVDKYVGVEAEPNRVKLLKDIGLEIIEGKFPNVEVVDTFDLVLSSHSIPERVGDYPQFLEKAWKRIKKKGWLVIITFKGAGDDLEDLTNQLRKNGTSDDKQKYDEMMRILSTFGDIKTDRIVSHSSSEAIEQMADLLSFSIGGTDEEKTSYRQKLKNTIKEQYKVEDKYVFPHEHLVLLIQKQ